MPRLDRSIVLVGMMGAGKSTIGRRLARRLAVEFVDSDVEIEKTTGLKTSELFELYGEDAFRDGERRVVARLVQGRPRVIATGGGAFNHPDTRSLLNRQAITVWLDAPIEVLAERTRRRDNRPLLRSGNRVEILQQLMTQRAAFYAQAHVRVPTSDSPHQEVVEAVVTAVSAHLNG
ncbi:shikimate kinase [Sphingomonas ginkgonis]|uniref:shikimate kinase n=1 Tax=Sphingomonas ginkgonis TaxID=2315330 RepID=UPI001EF05C5E|nr:shikimate kinase [Sphingomonas ginkgonis]